MSEDIWQVIARLRRAQPRNPDTMAVCDALEVSMRTVQALEEVIGAAQKEGRFDRRAYMREYMRGYMRKRRAKAKGAK